MDILIRFRHRDISFLLFGHLGIRVILIRFLLNPIFHVRPACVACAASLRLPSLVMMSGPENKPVSRVYQPTYQLVSFLKSKHYSSIILLIEMELVTGREMVQFSQCKNGETPIIYCDTIFLDQYKPTFTGSTEFTKCQFA